ncbi:MAG: galactokinase [Synergistaceae bacterium]|jgi:galactokinase|nr:galactokinase [Synergistaceae bacterium]
MNKNESINQSINQSVNHSISEKQVIQAFRSHFGVTPEFLVRTPGRVNLIGEHTDYNGGFVLPMTIDRALWMAVRGRSDGVVRVHSADYGEECSWDLRNELKKDSSPWFEYVKGCAWTLRQKNLSLSGFDGLLTGDVPQGAGLSSSAALEVTTILAFAELGGYDLPKLEVARLGQRAENEWIGMKCGIMDQTICALGQADKALLIDCRSLEHELFDLPESTVVALLDTDTRHSLPTSAYNERREQCETACRILGVPLLRDATQEALDAHKKDMPETVFRRARHIFSENLRVREAAVALRKKEAVVFGQLMNKSHFSLQYDFQISCFELDVISALAREHPACLGARMTGGGFGGSAVALLYAETEDFADYVAERYQKRTGKIPHITLCRATDGGKVRRV